MHGVSGTVREIQRTLLFQPMEPYSIETKSQEELEDMNSSISIKDMYQTRKREGRGTITQRCKILSIYAAVCIASL